MQDKFSTNKGATGDQPVNDKGYPRDSKDNPYFKGIQVKDIKPLLTEDAVGYWDFDTAIFQACQAQEESYIQVVCNVDNSTETYKNKTAWKGACTTEGKITETSKLGLKNIKLIADGITPLKISDHTITTKQVLKRGCGLPQVKEKILDLISSVKFQYEIENVKLLLGQGKVFRNLLPLPEEYKSNRKSSTRPLLLEEGRKWLIEELGAEVTIAHGTETCLECDDAGSIFGQEGYKHYKRYGKFNKYQIGFDKDDWQGNCLYINYHKKGVFFKLPQAILIQDTSNNNTGTIEMYEGEVKCSGIFQICKQIICGDSSDHYSPRLIFPKDIQPIVKGGYADIAFYKDFFQVTSPKEALEKTLSKMLEWFPDGLAYDDFRGNKVECDTMTWTNVLFMCVYMKRSYVDTMDLYKLCKAFKVDYSKLVNNHRPPAYPLAEEQGVRGSIEAQRSQIKELITLASDTKGTKPVLVTRLQDTVEKLKTLEQSLDKFFDKEPKLEHNTSTTE